jgi:hypothetical protein
MLQLEAPLVRPRLRQNLRAAVHQPASVRVSETVSFHSWSPVSIEL